MWYRSLHVFGELLWIIILSRHPGHKHVHKISYILKGWWIGTNKFSHWWRIISICKKWMFLINEQQKNNYWSTSQYLACVDSLIKNTNESMQKPFSTLLIIQAVICVPSYFILSMSFSPFPYHSSFFLLIWYPSSKTYGTCRIRKCL